MTGPRAGVFLDRDGVLNERLPPGEFVRSTADFRWIRGAADAVALLESRGYVPIVVSNQRGIAEGSVSWNTIRAVERLIQDELARRGSAIAGFHYCPHSRDAGCECRKPAPGLLLRAAREHGVDLSASVMVGDAESDVEAGRAAGCHTVLITTSVELSAADVVVSSLSAAVAAWPRLGAPQGP